ncbi:SAM-dependent methyltransferase [Pseudonocardia sichuanensis]
MSQEPKLPDVDRDTPNAARMYDYLLGGSHNFAADRAATERIKADMPWFPEAARANRYFLSRAVRFCVGEGIDQFLDLGSGIPTAGNVHEAARRLDPGARVAYVDNEPVTVASATALLDGDPHATITAADLRDPDAVFAAPGVRDLLDLSRPVALLTVAVLMFVPDEDDPAGILRRYRSRLAPGSIHVLTHGTADHDAEQVRSLTNVYRTTANPAVARTKAQVAELFGDTELVEPGLVDATDWRPDDNGSSAQHRGYWAGAGRIA